MGSRENRDHPRGASEDSARAGVRRSPDVTRCYVRTWLRHARGIVRVGVLAQDDEVGRAEEWNVNRRILCVQGGVISRGEGLA